MNSEALRRFYNEEAQRWGDSVRTAHYVSEGNFRLLRRHALRWISRSQRLRILDAGCGTGLFSAPLVRRHDVYGVDFSEDSLRFASQRGIRTSCADLKALPFEDGAFDATLCINTLQHFQEPRPVLNELARVTRPGGWLIVATINRASLQRRLLSLVWRPHLAAGLCAYTSDELKNEFYLLGLQEIQFLHLYYPLPYTTRQVQSGWLQDYFSSTIVIRGRKPFGNS